MTRGEHKFTLSFQLFLVSAMGTRRCSELTWPGFEYRLKDSGATEDSKRP